MVWLLWNDVLKLGHTTAIKRFCAKILITCIQSSNAFKARDQKKNTKANLTTLIMFSVVGTDEDGNIIHYTTPSPPAEEPVCK